MALPRVQSRGQVTLPVEIREAAGVAPGDTVMFRVIGPGRIEVSSLPRISIDEMIQHISLPDDFEWNKARQLAQQAASDEFMIEMERDST